MIEGVSNMIALKILDIKEMMNQLLIGTVFDSLELTEAVITTFNTFSIDGKIKRAFYDTDECALLDQSNQQYSLWKDIKPYCYSIIRGKKTPVSFKIIFQPPVSRQQEFSQKYHTPEIGGMYLNFQYRNKELICTTGLSLKTFIPNKAPEQQWDQIVIDFFRRCSIAFEML